LSLREELEEIAAIAGVTVDQLLKVAGILHILGSIRSVECDGDACVEPRRNEKLKRKIFSRIKAETVASVNEIIGEFGEKSLDILCDLEKDGKIMAIENEKTGVLVGVIDDGSCNIRELSRDEAERLIIDYYMNRGKGLSYKQVLGIRRRISAQQLERKLPTRAEIILNALRTGPKTRRELEEILSGRTVNSAISDLLEKGKIIRVDKGVYALANNEGKKNHP